MLLICLFVFFYAKIPSCWSSSLNLLVRQVMKLKIQLFFSWKCIKVRRRSKLFVLFAFMQKRLNQTHFSLFQFCFFFFLLKSFSVLLYHLFLLFIISNTFIVDFSFLALFRNINWEAEEWKVQCSFTGKKRNKHFLLLQS